MEPTPVRQITAAGREGVVLDGPDGMPMRLMLGFAPSRMPARARQVLVAPAARHPLTGGIVPAVLSDLQLSLQ